MINKESQQGITISLPDEFSIVEVDFFRKEIQSHIDSGINKFTIDFQNCKYIDSTGLGVLISIYKKAVEAGGNVYIKNIHYPSVEKIFKLTRLDKVFEII